MEPEAPERTFARYARLGDPKDLADVFDRTSPELLRLAMHLVSREADAEDLLQATFLTAIQKARRFDATRPLVPWLSGILVNHARRAAKERRRAKRLPAARTAPDPAEQVAGLELSDALRGALDRLENPYQEALQLRLVDGLSTVEIAWRLRRSPGAVRVQIHRGLEKLRRLLPPGLAWGSALAVTHGRGLAAVRETVHAESTAVGSTSVLFGGVLIMKKLLAAAVLMALALVYLFLPSAPKPPGEQVIPGADRTPGEPVKAAVETPMQPTPAAPSARQVLPPEHVSEPASLLVRVRWEADGYPAAGVLVRLDPQDGRDPRFHGREAQTGTDGTVLFESVVPGLARISLDRGVGAERDLAPGESSSLDLMVPPGMDVDGRVVDRDGQPVAEAEVYLDPPNRYSANVPTLLEPMAVSDADGRFRIQEVGPRMSVGARASGGGHSRILSVPLAGPTRSGQMTLVIEGPAFDLRGRVLDTQGRPVPSALVAIGERETVNPVPLPDGGWSDFWQCFYIRSDPEGRFLAKGLHPGKTWIRVQAEGHAPHETQMELPARGTPELLITLDPGGIVVGRVTDPDGNALSGAAILPATRRIDLLIVAELMRSDRQGRFRLGGLPAGQIRLLAHAEGYEQLEQALLLEPGVPREWNPVLSPLPRIRGVVLDEGGEPIPDARVFGRWAEETTLYEQYQEVADTTDRDGRFSLSVPHGKQYLLSILEPQASLLVPSGHPPVSGGPEDLVLVLPDSRRATARITGVLVDGEDHPLGNVSLGVDFDPAQFDLLLRAIGRTEPETGRFTVGPLAPGRYSIRASPRDQTEAPRTLGPFDLYPHQVLDLGRIGPVAAGELLFSYSASDGRRIEKITAMIESRDGSTEALLSAVPDEPTRHSLPVGDYLLEVWGDSFVSVTDHPVTIREDETTRVVLELEPGARRLLHFPVPLPEDWPETGEADVVLRKEGEPEPSHLARLSVRQPMRYYPSLGLGPYVLELTLDDGRRFEGRFTIDDLEPTEQPLEIEMRPL